MTLDLLFPNFETLIRTPEDVARLNEAILQLAVQGKLVPQDPADEPASELLKRIRAEKRRLVKEGKIEAEKLLPAVKQDEISFRLPQGWVWVRLGNAVLALQTGPFGSMLHKSDYVERGIPVVNPANVQDGHIRVLPEMIISESTRDRLKRYVLEQGDIVMGRRGEMGRCALVTSTEAGWLCGSGSFVLKTSADLDPEFLIRVIRSPEARGYLSGGSVGSTMNNLNHRILNSLVIGLPPLAEQRRIVAKVESLFAQTRALEAKLRQAQDDLVTLNRAALHRLSVAADSDAFAAAWATVRDAFDLLYNDPRNVAELRHEVLQLAVQGKLVPQDPADEPASELLKRIRAEKRGLVKEGKIKEDKALPSADSRQAPYHLPKGWSWGHFVDVANIATESTDPEKYPDLPHIAPDNIEKATGRLLEYRTVSEDEVRSVNHHFYPGQILYSKIRPNLSKAIIVEFEGLCSADMYPIEAFVDGRYLLRYILSGTFLEMVTKADTRVAMPKVNQDQLSKVLVAVPPLAEQRRIVAKVDQLMRQCDALAAVLARAEGQRRALTAAALHGAFG